MTNFNPISVQKSKGAFALNFLGLSLFAYRYSLDGLQRKQSFLNGLITTEKIYNLSTQQFTKTFKIIGLNILKRIDTRDEKFFYIAGIKIGNENFEKKFQKQYSKFTDNNHDDIYVINSNSGEAYVTLTYILSALITKNGSKNPLLLLTKKYHQDLVKLITPELDYKILPNFTNRIYKKQTILNGHRCFILYPFEYFTDVEKKIQNDNTFSTHYFNEMLAYTGLSANETSLKKIKVSPEIEQSMLNKINTTKLNLENFVFIAPEALSCDDNNLNSFWETTCQQLQQEGFDLFLNITKDATPYSNINYKTCDLTIAEAFALAQRAKKIISLRSGLSEILTQANKETNIIYTKFKRSTIGDIEAEKVLSGFNINKLPTLENNNILETTMKG